MVHELSTVRYLSIDWIEAVGRAAAGDERLASLAAAHEIGITQVVTDSPDGTVTYHLQVGDGDARFGAGAADPEHVRMEQGWDTAVAVATGQLNAQEAFVSGLIHLSGDQRRLLDAQPVFGALDAVFTSVRDRTEYA